MSERMIYKKKSKFISQKKSISYKTKQKLKTTPTMKIQHIGYPGTAPGH